MIGLSPEKRGNEAENRQAVPRRHRAYELVQYIYSCIRHKKDDSDDSLPGEIELCRKFSVSRGMAQRTIAGLLKGGFIIRKPRRRGIFINPVMREKLPLSIGIAVGGNMNNAMDGNSAAALAGFCGYIAKNVTGTQYFKYLSCEEIENIENEVAMQGLDGLIWIFPEEDSRSAIDSLAANTFPSVAVFSPYIRSSVPFPEKNSFIFDYEKYGRLFALALLRQGIKSPMLYGYHEATFDAVKKVFAENSRRIPKENLLEKEEFFPDSAMARIIQGKADAVVVKGAYQRYNSIIRQFKSQPESRGIPLYLDYDAVTKKYRIDNPDLDIRFIDKTSTDERLFQCGEKAAEKLLELFRNPGTNFASRFFH